MRSRFGDTADPLPELPSPILELRCAPASAQLVAATERSKAAAKAAEGWEHLLQGKRQSAHKDFQESFTWPDRSQQFSAIDWNAVSGEKRVRSYGPQIEVRMRERGLYELFVKQFRDPEVVLRTAYLSKILHHEHACNDRIPLVERCDYTVDGNTGNPACIVSVFAGEGLSEHLRSGRAAEQGQWIDAMREHTHRLLHYLTRREEAARAVGETPAYRFGPEKIAPLLAMRPEQYARKSLRSLELLSGAAPIRRAYALRDAAILKLRLCGDVDLFLPDVDPKAQNFVRTPEGRLCNVDLEKAVSLALHPAHLFAHVWFSPWERLSFEERLHGTIGDAAPYGAHACALDAVYYYLQRQVAIATLGVYVPFPDDQDLARRTVRGHLAALSQVAALPGIDGRYRCARALAGMDRDRYLGSIPFIPGQRVTRSV